MAVNISLKRSAVPGKIPTVNDLQLGELAINTNDGAIYFKKNVNNVETVLKILTTGTSGIGNNTVSSASYANYANFAGNASRAGVADSATLAISASYADNAGNAISSSYAETASTASYVLLTVSSSYAATASSADNFTVRGTLTAQTIVVQTITASTEYSSGSNIFGSNLANTQQFTGSVTVTGSLAVNGSNVVLSNQTSSMSVLSASYAATASFLLGTVTTAQTASYVLNAVSSSYATTASFATTASYALNTPNAVSASYAATSSNILGGTNNYVTKWTSPTSLGSSVMYDNGTNIGIGMLADNNYKLLVSGSVKFDLGGPSFAVLNKGGSAALYGAYTDPVSYPNSYFARADGANSVFKIPGSGGTMYFEGVSGFKMALFENGNFSIGTTSEDGYRLDVNGSGVSGSVRFRNGLTVTGSGIFDSLSLGTNPINVTTGYGNYISTVTYPIATEASTFWIKIISIDSFPQRIKLFIQASSDNTLAYDEFEIATSGYGMPHHILRKPTTRYNESKIVGILTSNLLNTAIQEVWINVLGTADSNSYQPFIFMYSNVSLESLANMQASRTTTKPTKANGGTELIINESKRINYTIQTSAGAEFNGPVAVSGSLNAVNGVTGSLLGTSSYATTASYALSAPNASNAITASYALTASYVSNAQTASYVLNAISASYHSGSGLISNAVSASYAQTASYILNAVSASYAITASYVLNAISASYSLSSSNATTASYVVTAQTASYILNAVSASYATTASNVLGGTTNFVTKWNTNTSLGSSLIYDNGTNIGIGTTDPGSLLSLEKRYIGYNITSSLFKIKGHAADAAAGTIFDAQFLNNAGLLIVSYYGGNESKVVIDGGNDNAGGNILIYSGSGQETTRINGSFQSWINVGAGNVGIGTSTPAYKLDVSGSLNVTSASYIDSTIIGQVPTYGSSYAQFSHYSRGGAGEYSFLSDSGGYTYINAKSNASIYFRINNSSVATILNNGNFGIGKTSPSSTLDVLGNTIITGSLIVTGSILQNGGALASQDGTILYYASKWFTPSSTISTSGTTATSVGTQFTSAMVGAKLTISGESRIITAYTSTTQVTVDSAYSQNYSSIASGNWGVYSRAFAMVDDVNTNNIYDSTGNKKSYFDINGNYINNSNYSIFSNTLSGGTFFSYGIYAGMRFSSANNDSLTDVRFRRISAGTVQIDNGSSDTAYRDLILRNITASGSATITGSLNVTGSANITGSLNVNGTGYFTGDVIAYYSDERLKTNIRPIGNALHKVMSLGGYLYNPNDLAVEIGATQDKDEKVGVLAQEVQAVLPHAIKDAPFDKTGTYMTVQYEKLVPLLIEAIKEQQNQINELKEKINGITK